jgi:glycerol-3-phosphate dehydrogenase
LKSNHIFSHIERNQGLQEARQANRVYDVLVIGGGITGAGIARDAALRGLSVCLVEKKDFAWGTSSRSSKLVHGGVRYLEHFEFALVQESTRERALLWKLAPQLVKPIKFLFPSFKSSRVPLWQLNIGLWMYDIIAKFQVPELHKKHSKKKTNEIEPVLEKDDLTGAIQYFDGATDDARLTLANIIDAAQAGATTLSRVELSKVEWNEKTSKNLKQAHTVTLKDSLTDEEFETKARSIICAAGPWTDEVLGTVAKAQKNEKLLAPTRGSHIVVPHNKVPVNHAIAMTHPVDKRVLFTIPWGEFTVLGTTDLFDEESPDSTHITSDEIDYLIAASKDYYPSTDLTRDDVISVWSGLRPLLAPPDSKNASAVSREHHLEWREPGLLFIAGGKLTTYRQMAEDVVDRLLVETRKWKAPLSSVLSECSTHKVPLHKFQYPSEEHSDTNENFIGKSEAGKITLQDIAGICQQQMVMTLEDLLVRRTHIYYKEPKNGWDLIPKIKDTVCTALDWDEETWNKNVQDYKDYLQSSTLEALGRSL